VGRPSDVLRHLVSVTARHADVGEDDVGRRFLQLRDRLIAVADRHDPHILVSEGQLDDTLNRDAVVGQKKGMRHLGSIGWIVDLV
jgi:hypothetical protein